MTKTIKTKNKPEFYSLKEALNLIGKKTFGDDFLFENHLGIIREKHGYYVRTLGIADLLIKNLFFETKKDDGKIFKQGENLFLIQDGKTVNNFKIPKQQFDYVLETGKRFCDKEQSEQPKIFIYKIKFHPNLIPLEQKFNEREASKIESLVKINDFGYWLKNNKLTKEQVFLVMLGVNPKYYQSLSYEEQQAIGRNKLLLDDDSNFQLHNIQDFINDFKSIDWQNNWVNLIKRLYQEAAILNPTFQSKCHRFIAYLKENKLLTNNHFDKYLKYETYRPDYEKYFTNQKNLTGEEVAFLVMGLEPEFAKQYLKYTQIINDDINKRYKALGDDEKVFFYKSYHNFLDENLIFIGSKYSILEKAKYTGDLWAFIEDLYNKGFLFDDDFLKYLKSNKKTLEYDQNSTLYQTLSFYSQMQHWTIEDITSLIQGKNPLDKNQIIFPLGRDCFNGFYIYENNDKSHSVRLKTNQYCKLQAIEQFYPKEGEGYKPQDVLEWLIKHTLITMPELLINLTFAKDKKRLAPLSKTIKAEKRRGRKPTISYPQIWKIFINEILEGNFDEQDNNWAKQAKLAFDNLDNSKKEALQKTAKSNLAFDIMDRCQKNSINAGTTSITNNIIEPFLLEFDKEFFQ